MEPAVGTAPTSAAYETAALLFELYGHSEPTKGSRTLDRPFTKRGLHLARRRSSRGGNRTHNVFRPPINSRAPCHSEHPGMLGRTTWSSPCFFSTNRRGCPPEEKFFPGRAKVLLSFQGTSDSRKRIAARGEGLEPSTGGIRNRCPTIGRTPKKPMLPFYLYVSVGPKGNDPFPSA